MELRRISIPENVAEEKLGDWLFSQINRRIKTYAVYEIDKCFDIFARTSGLHIVLDGLDEVASYSYQRVRIAINLLSEKLSKLRNKNIVIITLRTQFHQQVRNHFPEFPVVLSLKRFNAADIYTFLTTWPFEASKRSANIVRIYTNLGDQPALREMCTNPLVLSMYVAQDQAKGSPNTPETRTTFYSQVVDELMINRRAAQLGQVQQHVLLREQRRRIFGRIAFDHLVKGSEATNRIAWKDGIDIVRAVTKKSLSEAEHFFRDLSKETGLFTEERPAETFRFIHLTFCEFFAGFEAVQHRKDGWSELMKAFCDFSQADISKARLVEVIPFACALMLAHSRSDAIVEVHELADKYVLALSFLETKLYSHPLWRKFKDNYQEELISSSEANWGLEWLAKVHTFLVVCSDAERARNIIPLETGEATGEVAPFFQEFARRSQKPISVLIRSFAEQDAAAAFRVADLCGINVLNDAPDQIIRAERLIHVPAENNNIRNLYGDCFAIVLKCQTDRDRFPILAAFEDVKFPYSTRLGKVWFHIENIAVLFFLLCFLATYFLIVLFFAKIIAPLLMKLTFSVIKVPVEAQTDILGGLEMKTIGMAFITLLVVTAILQIVSSRAMFKRMLFHEIVNVREGYTILEIVNRVVGRFFPTGTDRPRSGTDRPRLSILKANAFFAMRKEIAQHGHVTRAKMQERAYPVQESGE